MSAEKPVINEKIHVCSLLNIKDQYLAGDPLWVPLINYSLDDPSGAFCLESSAYTFALALLKKADMFSTSLLAKLQGKGNGSPQNNFQRVVKCLVANKGMIFSHMEMS
jgi:hypothetical protein